MISVESLLASIKQWRWGALIRWGILAGGFSVLSLVLLYLLKDRLRMSLVAATFWSAEIATITRYFATNYWVFNRQAATWKGIWQFHCANAGAFVIWFAITNGLAHFKVHYLIAAAAAIGGTMVVNVLTNFLWIWRKEEKPQPAVMKAVE